MGTDIHAFVEVDYSTSGDPFGETAEVRCFNSGEFFLWHDYDLFDALGNGRNHGFPPAEVERWSLIPPRGLPSNVSCGVFARYYHPVIDPSLKRDRSGGRSAFLPGLRPVGPKRAKRWVKEGLSHYSSPPIHDAAGRVVSAWCGVWRRLRGLFSS